MTAAVLDELLQSGRAAWFAMDDERARRIHGRAGHTHALATLATVQPTEQALRRRLPLTISTASVGGSGQLDASRVAQAPSPRGGLLFRIDPVWFRPEARR